MFAKIKLKLRPKLKSKFKTLPKLRLFSAALAVLLVSAGCNSGGSSAKTVTLNVWGVFETSDNMAPFIQAYQQAHPNVRISYTEKNVATYEQDLINALASGNGPDVYEIQTAFLDVVKNDFVTSDGKIFAMPLTVDSLGLYYNKDILGAAGIATPPKTWNDLQADVKAVTKLNHAGTFTQSGVAMGTTSNIGSATDIMYELLLQNSPAYYTSDFSRSTLDQATQTSGGQVFPAVKALNFYTSFSNPASDVYTWNQNSNYSIDAFANGQLAFLYGYSFTRDTILQKAPNLNFDVTAVPQPDGNIIPVNFANYWGFGVSKQSQNPNYGWDFIKSMATKSSLTSYYQRHNLPSSRRDIIASQISDPVIGTFALADLTAKSFYKKDADKIDAIISKMIDDVILRGATTAASVSTAAQAIDLVSAPSS
jgi:ABC-type glycerol-3-phosphate transport system substrate-binding protein